MIWVMLLFTLWGLGLTRAVVKLMDKISRLEHQLWLKERKEQ